MAQVFVNGQVVEVSDIVRDIEALKLRFYLQVEHGNDTEAKLHEIGRMQRQNWSPSKIVALEKVKEELKAASV